MIVVDSSAIVAIAKKEPDGRSLADAIGNTNSVMAAPSALETKMVLSGALKPSAIDDLFETLVGEGRLRIVDFTPAMADAAVTAFRTYGKGRGHPAQLNFGDCMAYGVAKVMGASLLYKGGDFALTDIRPALA